MESKPSHFATVIIGTLVGLLTVAVGGGDVVVEVLLLPVDDVPLLVDAVLPPDDPPALHAAKNKAHTRVHAIVRRIRCVIWFSFDDVMIATDSVTARAPPHQGKNHGTTGRNRCGVPETIIEADREDNRVALDFPRGAWYPGYVRKHVRE
jgi:hypothetical protein